MKSNKWVLGFFGFLGFLGVPYLRHGDWMGLTYMLWFIWFYYFTDLFPTKPDDDNHE